tara:strand:- start:1308 stop:1643 length:336 start_codon:yes stop_codon:yes gene_type:complete
MIDKNILITIIIYLYFILTTIFSDDLSIIRVNIFAILFLLLKWILNYRKCTLSYIECKIRNIKKEKSHIYNYCEFFGDLIYNEYNDILFLLLVILLLINLFKICKNIQRHI